MGSFGDLQLTVLLFGTWFAVGLLWLGKRRLPADIALFVFLLMSIVETVLYTAVSLNFGWLSFPDEPKKYAAHLLLRSALWPVIYLYAVRYWLLGGTRLLRWSAVVAAAAARFGLTWASVRLELISLEKVGLLALALSHAALVIAACLAARGFVWYTRGSGVTL